MNKVEREKLTKLLKNIKALTPSTVEDVWCGDVEQADNKLEAILKYCNEAIKILDSSELFAYYIETELQDGSMEGSFIKADSMKYKYIADCCDMIGGPIALYK